LLGEAAIEDDGSFHLLVPPNTPMQLQILDEDGIALRTSAWMWTKNKENRGCIGCHEDGELSPENVFPKALGKPAADLMLAPERARHHAYTAGEVRELSQATRYFDRGRRISQSLCRTSLRS
jgi:hypothetical protein